MGGVEGEGGLDLSQIEFRDLPSLDDELELDCKLSAAEINIVDSVDNSKTSNPFRSSVGIDIIIKKNKDTKRYLPT
jgi:hypothetical protein